MKLSIRGRYALLALVDIARHQHDGLVSMNELSKRQDVSLPYLEQLFSKLRKNGLLTSVRGPGGGYRLSRPTSEIWIAEILSAVDETIDALSTGAGVKGGASGTDEQALSNRLWEGLSAHVYLFLHQATMADVIGNTLVPCPAIPALLSFEDA